MGVRYRIAGGFAPFSPGVDPSTGTARRHRVSLAGQGETAADFAWLGLRPGRMCCKRTCATPDAALRSALGQLAVVGAHDLEVRIQHTPQEPLIRPDRPEDHGDWYPEQRHGVLRMPFQQGLAAGILCSRGDGERELVRERPPPPPRRQSRSSREGPREWEAECPLNARLSSCATGARKTHGA